MSKNITIELLSSKNQNSIEFDIKGTSDEGLNVSIVNGIRKNPTFYYSNGWF